MLIHTFPQISKPARLGQCKDTFRVQLNIKSVPAVAVSHSKLTRVFPLDKQLPSFKNTVSLESNGEIELVNECEQGFLAGSPRLWGIAVVSGAGCNCRGWMRHAPILSAPPSADWNLGRMPVPVN